MNFLSILFCLLIAGCSSSDKRAESFYNKGLVLLESNSEKAIVEFDKAIKLKPDYAEAYFGKGLSLEKSHRLQKALVEYDFAIKYKSDYAEAYYHKCWILGRLGRYDEAGAAYDLAIKYNPDSETLYSLSPTYVGGSKSFLMLKSNKFQEALQEANLEIKNGLDYTVAHFNKSIALIELNMVSEAIDEFKITIEKYLSESEDIYDPEITAFDFKKIYKTLRKIDGAIKSKPNYYAAYFSEAGILTIIGHYEEALVSAEKALKIRPKAEEALKLKERIRKKIDGKV